MELKNAGTLVMTGKEAADAVPKLERMVRAMMETLNQALIEGGIVKAAFSSDCTHVILCVGEIPHGFKVMVRMSPKIPAEGLVPGRRLREVGQLRKDGGLYIMAEHVDFGPKED